MVVFPIGVGTVSKGFIDANCDTTVLFVKLTACELHWTRRETCDG